MRERKQGDHEADALPDYVTLRKLLYFSGLEFSFVQRKLVKLNYFYSQFPVSIITGGANLKIVPKIFTVLKVINNLPNHANRNQISPGHLVFLTS